MKNDFIDDLIHCVRRVVVPNTALLRDVLVIGGMPAPTQNLQYLSYNRHTTVDREHTYDFSAVAVINNRRVTHWQLRGYAEKISRWVFSTRWTRNPLDLFLNNLRCDRTVMGVLAGAESDFSLLGILTSTQLHGGGIIQRPAQYIRPVLAVPGIDERGLRILQAFEAANRIKMWGLGGVKFYRKLGGQMVIA
ncbi:hypothetical protein DESC_200011 [Desulfosarcina cetonica]|uniref:hypothetical protein n=1 Tax=Desulfosarcina cetonica TaxID=90730 RepID=UPI0006CFD148|nr:hypothetical protein [Desulfosarcina cetonica]VTR64576.1 hypothetical protein DESC_200011 [Desulfosarcina cetonica]